MSRSPSRFGRSLAVALALFATSGLAGCGGGSDDAGAEDEITATLERAMTRSDPAICAELFTDRALEQLAFLSANDPLGSCEENIGENPEDAADSIAVGSLEISGERATAVVRSVGGDLDGGSLELELVAGDPRRIDRLGEIHVTDRERYLRTYLNDLNGLPAIASEERACFGRHLRDMTMEESASLDDDPAFRAALEAAIQVCIGPGGPQGTPPATS